MKNFLTLIFSRIFSCRCSVKIVQSSPINDGSCPKMYISSMTKVACVDLHVYIVLFHSINHVGHRKKLDSYM